MEQKAIDDLRIHLDSKKTQHIALISSEIRQSAGIFLRQRGFVELNPVIISPLTDPLHHKTLDGTINYLDHRFFLTRSMIFHKQISLLGLEKIFIFSPNVRLEPPEYAQTGKHLIEFTQIDVEMKNATRDEVMELAEQMFIYVLDYINGQCSGELSALERSLAIPKRPFKRIEYLEAYKEYGPAFEMSISQKAKEPFWLVDFPIEAREFYDREYEDRPGILCDMDMIYPAGYGEALSGGEREYKYERIWERTKNYGRNLDDFWWYLELAKRGLPRCAGFGIGVERLTRYICGLSHIAEATIFPKIPGALGI